MKFKCDECGRPATVHMTEIVGGEKIEKHLCEDCAISEGITIKTEVPISQLLEDFVLQTSEEKEGPGQAECDVCGITFEEFQKQGLLGCPNDYDVFSDALIPLLERTQGGSSQHIGKVPQQASSDQKRQNMLLRLRAELKGAVAAEDYERAAMLRDQIDEYEKT